MTEEVQRALPEISNAAVRQNWQALQYVPAAVQLAHPNIPLAAVQQYGMALRQVSEAVQRDNPAIPLAAVQQDRRALRYVQESLKTNVEALAKLYTTSEAQLRSDLLALEINDDVINQVICYLKASIATSSIMIVDLLGTGNDSKQNDSKQPAENPVESRGILPESGVLSIMQEYVNSPSNQENEAKESDLSLS